MFVDSLIEYIHSLTCVYYTMWSSYRNIIFIHNNVLWDWQYYMEYSMCKNVGIFNGILAVPRNTIMDLNNVMNSFLKYSLISFKHVCLWCLFFDPHIITRHWSTWVW